MRTDQEAFKNAYLGAMPATLFVLLPVFALMLKVAYVFKRRLYMEHLLVALHSHAFLCLALLLVFLVMARSEEHTSELQSLMRTSYAVFCLNKKTTPTL